MRFVVTVNVSGPISNLLMKGAKDDPNGQWKRHEGDRYSMNEFSTKSLTFMVRIMMMNKFMTLILIFACYCSSFVCYRNGGCQCPSGTASSTIRANHPYDCIFQAAMTLLAMHTPNIIVGVELAAVVCVVRIL